MKEKFRLKYTVSYDADFPIREEECNAVIEAVSFQHACEKASDLINELRMSPNVLSAEILSLRDEMIRR